MLYNNKLYQKECQAVENFFFGSTKLQQDIFTYIFKTIVDYPEAHFSQINAAKKLGCNIGYFNIQAHEFAKYGFFRIGNRGANKTCIYGLAWRLQNKEVLQYLSKIFPFLFKYKIILLLSDKFLPEYEKLGKEDIFLINININKKYNKMSKKLNDFIYYHKLTRKRKRNFVEVTLDENNSFNKDYCNKENNCVSPAAAEPADSFFKFSLEKHSIIDKGGSDDMFDMLKNLRNQAKERQESAKSEGSLSWFMKFNRNNFINRKKSEIHSNGRSGSTRKTKTFSFQNLRRTEGDEIDIWS